MKRGHYIFSVLCLLLPYICSALQSNYEMSSLQKRIDALPEGSEFTIPPGTYYGNLEIKKTIKLSGNGQVLLDGKKNGHVIQVSAPHVHLRGIKVINSGIELGDENAAVLVEDAPHFRARDLHIRSSLFGIILRGSPHSSVKHIKVEGLSLNIARRGDTIKVWYSPDIEIANNIFKAGRDMVVWYSDRSKIINNVISGGRYGIHFMYSHDSQVEGNTLQDNLVGIYMMYSHGMILQHNTISRSYGSSGFGMALKESDKFNIRNNTLIGNRIGLHADNSPMSSSKNLQEKSQVVSNTISYNDIGFNFIGRGAGILITRNDFNQNWTQVSSKGVRSVKADWIENYWSDYAGVDLKGTGFGTFPYRAKNLFNSLTENNESFKIFSFGPAIIALNFAEKMLPWLNDNTKFEDKTPKMAPWKKTESRPIRYIHFFISLFFGFTAWTLWRFSRL